MFNAQIRKTAIAASLLVHLAGLVAIASWPARPHRSPVRFDGGRRAIALVVTLDEPVWQVEPMALQLPSPLAVPVEIGPSDARIAQRHFVHTPARAVSLSELTAKQRMALESKPPAPSVARASDSERQSMPERTIASAASRRRVEHPRPALPSPERQVAEVGTAPTRPASLANSAPPTYPALAIQRGWEGTVLLRVEIDASGQVRRVTVARSSGHAILDGAAVNAVRQWRGIPAYRGQQAVATVELLPIRFRL